MKTPKFTDLHRYPHGYKKANETDITGTFRRVLKEREQNKREAEAKVQLIPKRRNA